MRGIFQTIWETWKKIAFAIGNAISFFVLVVFYFTIYAIFAILYKIFGKNTLKQKGWVTKQAFPHSLEYFKKEF